jgi:hypothetical protein
VNVTLELPDDSALTADGALVADAIQPRQLNVQFVYLLVLAVRVFEQAQEAGEPVSMPLVRRVIAELDDGASAQQVYQLATIWERSVNATRRQGRARCRVTA